jgi:hypothetical protein
VCNNILASLYTNTLPASAPTSKPNSSASPLSRTRSPLRTGGSSCHTPCSGFWAQSSRARVLLAQDVQGGAANVSSILLKVGEDSLWRDGAGEVLRMEALGSKTPPPEAYVTAFLPPHPKRPWSSLLWPPNCTLSPRPRAPLETHGNNFIPHACPYPVAHTATLAQCLIELPAHVCRSLHVEQAIV